MPVGLQNFPGCPTPYDSCQPVTPSCPATVVAVCELIFTARIALHPVSATYKNWFGWSIVIPSGCVKSAFVPIPSAHPGPDSGSPTIYWSCRLVRLILRTRFASRSTA